MGIYQGVANARLSREVHDGIESLPGEHLRDRVRIGQVITDKGKSLSAGEMRKPRLFQTDVVIGIQIVEANYPIPAIQKSLGGVEADEACRAGNERFRRGSCFQLTCSATGKGGRD